SEAKSGAGAESESGAGAGAESGVGGRMRLVLLGTGTPEPDPRRSGPASAIVIGGQAYLIDAGAGIVRQAAAARRAGIEALAPSGLSRVFLTHLHSDHTVGLPDLALSPWVVGRSEPLTLYGPPGASRLAHHLMQAYEADVTLRIHGLEQADPDGWRIASHEIQAGEVYRDARLIVRAFRVEHGSSEHAFGYRFEGGGRVIVLSGDTAPSDAIVRACNGCDLLVHEVYSTRTHAQGSASFQRYHRSFHTSASELGELASRARPRLLVLNHGLLWGASREEVLEEIRERFEGGVVFGEELGVY
ncbi:MAG: MBL fold metallo-hydrolase, partial [Myxococcales bacterium]|nr:MBL fold metallo-hydrolase [Myxococcales bacterium]